MSNIILSIAIPTYNRAEYLDKTLQSIVNQNAFKNTNEVEIIVSDNCSDDNTTAIVATYISKYGSKILYFRNEENLRDKNMELALARGNGLFLKLNNDTLMHRENTLDVLLDTIKSNISSRNVLFFLNHSFNKVPCIFCQDLNEFVDHASFYSSWIASFGIWKEDFDNLDDYGRYSELQLVQTDVLHRTIGNSKKKVYINNDLIFVSQDLTTKGGYDIITVFLENYTYILRESLAKGFISNDTYTKEIKTLLLNFICDVLTDIVVFPKKFYFKAENKFKRIVSFYKDYPITLLQFFVKYYLLIVYKKVRGR